jgi:hypothetical protein
MTEFTPPGASPDAAFPRFHLRPVRQGFKSEQAGRDIWEDAEYVEIFTPGMTRSIPCEPVGETHRGRWPAQYEAFRKGLEPPAEGTPLEQWPPLSPAQVLTLKAAHVRTVEQLAEVSDAALQTIGLGARGLRTKAGDWLASAKSAEPLARERARADAAEAEVARLSAQVAELAGRLAATARPPVQAEAGDVAGKSAPRTRRA